MRVRAIRICLQGDWILLERGWNANENHGNATRRTMLSDLNRVFGESACLLKAIRFTDAQRMQVVVMKQRIREFIRDSVGHLPWGVREAALEGLLKRAGNREVLERMARQEGITVFGCDGEFGRVVSSNADHAVLGRYAKTGTFASKANGFFNTFFGSAGGTYLDIGANIGLTTIGLSRNPLISCIAFEPDPTNFRNLTDNVQRNCIHGNVTLHQLALLDKAGPLRFSLASDGNLGDHRIAAGSETRETIEVMGARLDDVVTSVRHPFGAKIDVQGAEPFVIAGGARLLSEVGAFTIEFSPYHMGLLDADGGLVIDYLSGFSRLACVRGDSDEELDFGAPRPILDRLKRVLQEWTGEEYRYLDIYALR